MRGWKTIVFAGVVAVTLAGVAFFPTEESPIARDAYIVKLRDKWQHDLLLPTKLPENHVLSAQMFDEGPIFRITLELIIKTDRTTSGKLDIEQQVATDTEITKLQGQALPEIEQGLRDFKPRPPGHYYGGQINALEKIEVGDGTGYWYTTYQDVPPNKIDTQYIEFIQDDLHVTLSTMMPTDLLSKSELIEIARSFKKS